MWLTNSIKHSLAWDWLLVVPVGETRRYRHLKTTHFTHKNPPLVPVWATPYVRLHLPNGLSSSSAPTEEGHSLLTPVRILQSRLSLVTSKNYKDQLLSILPSSFTFVQAQIFSSAYLSLTQSTFLIWVSFTPMHNRQIYKENNLNEMFVTSPKINLFFICAWMHFFMVHSEQVSHP
jgi:hypothetical protein